MRHTIASFAGRRRHRVDKSLPGRHSRPSNAERECRPLPTRPAGRHCRRQMPTVRARRRGVGISDPRVGMSQRCASRVTAASVTMAMACMVVSSTWAGGVPGNGKGRRHLRHPHFPTVRNMVSNGVPSQDTFSLLDHFSAGFRFSVPLMPGLVPLLSRFNFGTASVRPRERGLSPRCHPGLDPGSRLAPDFDPGKAGRGRCPWALDPGSSPG